MYDQSYVNDGMPTGVTWVRSTEEIENPAWFVMWMELDQPTASSPFNAPTDSVHPHSGLYEHISCGLEGNANATTYGPFGSANNYPPMRHMGSGNVAFCDGHVAAMNAGKMGGTTFTGPWTCTMSDDNTPG